MLDQNKNGGGVMIYIRDDIPSGLLLTHSSQCILFLSPENIRKRFGFLCFHGVEKGCTENEWVKDVFPTNIEGLFIELSFRKFK